MEFLRNGDLIAGGVFSAAGGVDATSIARWDGSSWSALGLGMNSYVWALAVMPNGDLIAGGGFTTAGGEFANRIARWDGSRWFALGSGVNNDVLSLAVMPNGDLIASGFFSTAGGVPANHIARWNGSAWSAVGSGIGTANNFLPVIDLAVMPNGDLIAGGDFTTAGGATASRIARYTPSTNTWSALGSGMNGPVQALAVASNGDLLAGGNFTTAGGGVSAYFAHFSSGCPCTADMDDGTGSGARDGGVTIDDLLYYVGIYFENDARADLDNGTFTGTPDGGVTIDDLLYYLLRFEAGC